MALSDHRHLDQRFFATERTQGAKPLDDGRHLPERLAHTAEARHELVRAEVFLPGHGRRRHRGQRLPMLRRERPRRLARRGRQR
jgi:hypothetical protein